MNAKLAIEIIFYAAAALLLYTYLLYPLLLMLLPFASDRRTQDSSPADIPSRWPFVSVVVAAYNEERVIADKIRNFLASDYAGESEIVIVSDASSDGTNEVVQSLASDRVRLIVQERRQGKGAALNRALPEARGEILVFTDATSMFARQTLTELVRPFADASVGLVNGRIHYKDAEMANLYHRYERFLKDLEIRHGLIATAHGAIYAIRKSLCQPHDPRLVNDFLDPITVSLRGYRATAAPSALCYEEFSMDAQFRRQVRMVALAALVYFTMVPRLVRAGQWRSLFVLTSHKLLRWLTGVWLLVIVGASLWLAPAGALYRGAFAGEALFGGLALFGCFAGQLGLGERVSFVYRFLILNVAAAWGLWLCLRGRIPSIWQPNGI